jgi:hypothetical protein
MGAIELASVYSNAGVMLELAAGDRQKLFGEATAIAEKLIATDSPSYVHALAYSVRAACNDNLGRTIESERDHNEAIRLAPEIPSLYFSRSEFWRLHGRPDLQQKDLAMERKLRSE